MAELEAQAAGLQAQMNQIAGQDAGAVRSARVSILTKPYPEKSDEGGEDEVDNTD